jgi:hypothetical protein
MPVLIEKLKISVNKLINVKIITYSPLNTSPSILVIIKFDKKVRITLAI